MPHIFALQKIFRLILVSKDQNLIGKVMQFQ